jgi:Peptidase M15
MKLRIASAVIGVALSLAVAVLATTGQARTYKATELQGRGILSFLPLGTSLHCLSSAALRLLDRIEVEFGSVEIISTCRPGAIIAGSSRPSLHGTGNAIDFNAGDRKAVILKWLIAHHNNGGTMTYADMDHIHVDIGRRFVSLAAPSRQAGAGRARGDGAAPATGWKYDWQRMGVGASNQ